VSQLVTARLSLHYINRKATNQISSAPCVQSEHSAVASGLKTGTRRGVSIAGGDEILSRFILAPTPRAAVLLYQATPILSRTSAGLTSTGRKLAAVVKG
jgi:hypothetical protein